MARHPYGFVAAMIVVAAMTWARTPTVFAQPYPRPAPRDATTRDKAVVLRAPELPVGTRVRGRTTAGQYVEGRVTAAGRAALRLEIDRGGFLDNSGASTEWVLNYDDVDAMEYLGREQDHVVFGVLAGLFAGAAIGSARNEVLPLGSIVGAVVGGIVRGALGSVITVEQWVPVDLPPSDLEGCSVFALRTGEGAVVGANLDLDAPMPGLVVLNVRGEKKTILPWKGKWPDPREWPEVSWVSRYGSVTFTAYGRDFIEGGMNEAGLVVEQATLGATYPPEDDRPGVSCAQWMQYQLDNYTTVAEVVAHLGELRPDGEGWHYLIADATGACAVIEYPGGAARVITGDDLAYPAITNTPYESAAGQLHLDRRFGGEADIAAGNDSYGRFVRLAVRMRDRDPRRDDDAAGYAFGMLDGVAVNATLRSVVYDPAARRVLWKTRANDRVRTLDLDAVDISSGVPVRCVGIDVGLGGDVLSLFETCTERINGALTRAVLFEKAHLETAVFELIARGLTPGEALDRIARHPGGAAGARETAP